MDEIEALIPKRKPGRQVGPDEAIPVVLQGLAENKVQADREGLGELGDHVHAPLPGAGAGVEDPLRTLDGSEVVRAHRLTKGVVLKVQPVDLSRVPWEQVAPRLPIQVLVGFASTRFPHHR